MPTTERMPVMPLGPTVTISPERIKAAINAVPLPVRRSVALARRGAPVASQSGADEMVLGEKMFEVFVRRADIDHMILLVPIRVLVSQTI